LKWIDVVTKGGLSIATEGRDEDDLINLTCPPKVTIHKKVNRHHIRPIIKVALDSQPAHKLYPSRDYPKSSFKPLGPTPQYAPVLNFYPQQQEEKKKVEVPRLQG
jgi:hypothetical protein